MFSSVLSDRSQSDLVRSWNSLLSRGGTASDSLCQSTANSLIVAAFDLHNECPYGVSPEGSTYLASLGISVSPLSIQGHSHPVHKYLETDLLYRRLPQYMQGRCLFIQIKPSKVVADHFPHSSSLTIHNVSLNVRDFGRWIDGSPLEDELDSIFLHDVGQFLTPS